MYSLKFALLLNVLMSVSLMAGEDWKYISPKPGSSYVNPENQIALRHGDKINVHSLDDFRIQVNGSLSGDVRGELSLSRDGRTLIFRAKKEFYFGEKINVQLSEGITTESGKMLHALQFEFYIIQQDNTNLLAEFYQWMDTRENAYMKSATLPVSQKRETENLITYGDYSLPADFPEPSVSILEDPEAGYTFCTPRPRGSASFSQYNLILDKYGIPLFYLEWPNNCNLFQRIPDDRLMYCSFSSNDPASNKWLVMNNKYEYVDTLMMGNGYHVDQHGGYMFENGNHFLIAYDPQIVGMDTVVPGGDPNATVVGLIIQELDADHNVIFQWRSWDHFEITDANDIDFTGPYIDYVHCNSIYPTPDENILISCRPMDEITKIDRNSGEIIWRFGKYAKNNMFTIENDTAGFSKQHDAFLHPDGSLTVYDNGVMHEPQFSQSMRYNVDENDLTANLDWIYVNDPVIYAFATGSTKWLENGNTLTCWGLNWPVAYTEVSEEGEIEWEVNYPDSVWQYAAFRDQWKQDLFICNYDTIDYGYHDDYIPWPRIFTLTNNSDEDIVIHSGSNHLDEFYLATPLPATIPASGSLNMTVYFYPQTDDDFEDVLSLNHDDYFSDSLSRRIALQIVLKGTTLEPTIREEKHADLFELYPNPAYNKLFIKSKKQQIESMVVYTTDGRIVLVDRRIKDKLQELDISGLSKGMYFLELKFNAKGKSEVHKFIKN